MYGAELTPASSGSLTLGTMNWRLYLALLSRKMSLLRHLSRVNVPRHRLLPKALLTVVRVLNSRVLVAETLLYVNNGDV